MLVEQDWQMQMYQEIDLNLSLKEFPLIKF